MYIRYDFFIRFGRRLVKGWLCEVGWLAGIPRMQACLSPVRRRSSSFVVPPPPSKWFFFSLSFLSPTICQRESTPFFQLAVTMFHPQQNLCRHISAAAANFLASDIMDYGLIVCMRAVIYSRRITETAKPLFSMCDCHSRYSASLKLI